MSLLVCQNLCIGYENNQILKNINFSIAEGDILSVVGENGSGKTTLLKAILGLVHPISGEIKTEKITKMNIGYLPQQTFVQKDFPASVYEVVLSGTVGKTNRLFYNSYDKNTALENMKKLDIFDLKQRSFKELSGGQQQRVLIARALCAATKLLVLDEPTSGLDPVATSQLYSALKTLNDKEKLSVIMVSHDIKSALEFSDKILHLNKDNMFFGTTNEYLKTEIYAKMIGGK